MNQITDDIWIGAIEDVSEHPTDRFGSVLSVCQDTRQANVGCHYRHVPLAEDTVAEQRWGGSCEYPAFQRACATLQMALRNDETVLVHCHNGQNRSVSVVAAVLAARDHRSVGIVLDEIRQARPIANPSDRMLRHACRYAKTHS